MTLGQLNKNINKVGKSLSKISTGQRIVSARDNASDYGISEQMRVQIRALEQDMQNVQNGSSMLKTAFGGINDIVEELRSLKELAINAANDSNSDEDRVIIQRDFDQKRASIDEIATWTNYNTKPLLDGTYANSMRRYGITYNLENVFLPGSPNCERINMNETGYGHGIVPDISYHSKGLWNNSPLPGLTFPGNNNVDSNYNIAVKMDFSKSSQTGQGFSILCGGCEQYINIKFDSSISAAQSTRSREPDGSTEPIEYTIGTSGVSDLAQAIYEGVKAIDGNRYTATSQNGSTEKVMLDINHQVNVLKMNGEYYITKESEPPLCIYHGLIDGRSSGGQDGKPLTIHHGPHANQAINFYINDMHGDSLGISFAEVTTKPKANEAIRTVDEAISYALHEATYVGSYLQRLEYTESNLTTMNENTQGAESTIRDADMAKEMTEYTKNNVLSQASQSMLAQANQNMSSVLSLLQ